MATVYQNLSAYHPESVPDGQALRIGIVVSEWNQPITNQLLGGALDTLQKHGVASRNVIVKHVPGSFELTFGAKALYQQNLDLNAVIILGCVVRGDTPHFDYVCSGVTQGITTLNVTLPIPFIFGLLTTDTMQQATDRAGGVHGNKGDEAAVTAIKMAQLFASKEL